MTAENSASTASPWSQICVFLCWLFCYSLSSFARPRFNLCASRAEQELDNLLCLSTIKLMAAWAQLQQTALLQQEWDALFLFSCGFGNTEFALYLFALLRLYLFISACSDLHADLPRDCYVLICVWMIQLYSSSPLRHQKLTSFCRMEEFDTWDRNIHEHGSKLMRLAGKYFYLVKENALMQMWIQEVINIKGNSISKLHRETENITRYL